MAMTDGEVVGQPAMDRLGHPSPCCAVPSKRAGTWPLAGEITFISGQAPQSGAEDMSWVAAEAGEALRVDVMALACGVVARALGWDSVGVGESGGEGVHGLIAKCGD